MIHLRLPNNAAQLAEHTALVPVRSNVTRWSSVWEMIDRYVSIRDAVRHIPSAEDLLPRGAAHRRIVALHEKLDELNSVCLKLQYSERSLAEVRALFDACVDKYPIMVEHLKPAARVVHSPLFEAAIVKMTSGHLLSPAELKTLEPFRRPEGTSATSHEEPGDFATEILRRSKKPRRSERTLADYVPLMSVLPPTSNRCERLFSECKYVLSPHRSSLHPANFEMLMFLKANRDLWNSSTLLP